MAYRIISLIRLFLPFGTSPLFDMLAGGLVGDPESTGCAGNVDAPTDHNCRNLSPVDMRKQEIRVNQAFTK